MSKIVIGIIITVTSICFIGFLLYPNNNHELQTAEKNIQNISQDEILKEEIEKEEIEEKKSSSQIIIYFIIGVFLFFIIVIGLVILIRKKKLEKIKKIEKIEKIENIEKIEKKIFPIERIVENFIKVKVGTGNKLSKGDFFGGEFLLNWGFQFVANILNIPKEKLSKFNEKDYLKLYDEKQKVEIFFVKISDMPFGNAKEVKIFRNDKKERPEETLLGLLESGFNKEQIKKKFQGHENLLNLILIVRLGIFGNLDTVNKVFQTGLLKDENLNKTRDFINIDFNNEIKNFFKFDEETVKKNNEDFFNDVNNIWKCKINSETIEAQKKFYQKLSSLIGDQNTGYQVDKSSFDFLINFELSFLLLMDTERFYPDSVTNYYLLQKIQSILKYFGSNEKLNKEENFVWRAMIKTLIDALIFFKIITNELLKENEQKKHK